MTEKTPQPFSTLISAAAALAGSEGKTSQFPDVATVLKSRLARTYEILREDHANITDAGLKELQYITAKDALYLVEQVQCLLDPQEPTPSVSGHSMSPPLLGARDLSHIRTLLSVIFKWAVVPLVDELELVRPGVQGHTTSEPRIIDLTERPLDSEELPAITVRLLALIFGSGLSAQIRQSWITTSILSRHAVDLLTPCLIIGWTSKPVFDSFARYAKDIKALSIRFINVLRPHEAIATLGTILSTRSSKQLRFPHLTKACTALLGGQLKRPDGIRGLCTAVFGEDAEELDSVPLDKLEHVSKVLSTVPALASPKDYYQTMVPRILALLLPSCSERTPPAHKRAAAFVLSRMLSVTFQHRSIASAILLPLLHAPLLTPSRSLASDEQIISTPHVAQLAPAESIQTLQTFVLHADPSPTELSTLLTPIVPELYTLVSLHRTSKTADPNVRETLDALLTTWGRIVSSSDAASGIWRITSGAGGNWELVMDGFVRSTKPMPLPSITLFDAVKLEAGSEENVDIDINPFNLRPDPAELVTFLKTLDRKDVSSEFFVKLLNEYRKSKESDAQPMQTLLYLQLILQIQAQLSTTVLSRPEHVLSFIRHALNSESLPSGLTVNSKPKKGLSLSDLRIVEADVPRSGDSDDEEESGGTENLLEPESGKDEMTVTAVTLLLSILEANANLSPRSTPDLNDILVSLDRFTVHGSAPIRQLVREARLVLTARSASTSSAGPATMSHSTVETETAQATYQKALKLLQDPIIPVRAHGLQLLRELVRRPSAAGTRGSQPRPDGALLDPALVPGILSIFLQSIQNDESYIFLNAVQGLAAMVDGYGKDVLRGMVDVYLSGTGVGASGVAGAGGTTMLKDELDARIRVGEALNTVVKRCGGALGSYVDMLIPPLLTLLRSSHMPTTLRTSALSILAQCVTTNILALSTYAANLADTCIELIQLESVAAKSVSTRPDRVPHPAPQGVRADVDSNDANEGGDSKQPVRQPDLMDLDPTTKTAKAAPFRRSALHFLSQLLSSHIQKIYESRTSSTYFSELTLNVERSHIRSTWTREETIPEGLLKRAGVVLGYVSATDEDSVTRVMAREVLELVDQFKEASLGI